MKISKEVREFLSKVGRKGGSQTSDRKAKAARENGRKNRKTFPSSVVSRNKVSSPHDHSVG